MPRKTRTDVAGQYYHVLNRITEQAPIFKTEDDYRLIFQVITEVIADIPIEIIAYCLMPNHWHFVVKTKKDGDLGHFFGRFSQKIAQRFRKRADSIGRGHLFQDRFKSSLIENGHYLNNVVAYVEANALRANLVNRAEDWKWGSLYLRLFHKYYANKLLCEIPFDLPINYLDYINSQETQDLALIRHAVQKEKPYGSMIWVNKVVFEFNIYMPTFSRSKNKGQTLI